MKIVIVGHAYPPYISGLSNVLYNVSKELVKLGHEVTIITLKLHSHLKKEDIIDGVKVIRVPGYAPSNAYFIPSHKFLDTLISIKDVDIIHIHNIGALTVPCTVLTHAVFKGSSKLVITPHYHESGSTFHTRLAWPLYKPIVMKCLRKASVVHAVSPFEAELLKRDFGIKSVIIPNGVNEDIFLYNWTPPAEPVIIYAGRVEKYKRVHLLVEAVARAQRYLKQKIILI